MPRGRPKGSLNRKTREALHAIKESQLDANGLSMPVRYLLSIVANRNKPEALRIEAAKASAPFLQPKLAAVDLTNTAPAIESEEVLLGKLSDLIKANPEVAQLLAQHVGPTALN